MFKAKFRKTWKHAGQDMSEDYIRFIEEGNAAELTAAVNTEIADNNEGLCKKTLLDVERL